MRCSKCGAESPDRAKFCGECASPFTRRCSSCGTENSLTIKFCIECAKPLEDASKLGRAPDAGRSIRVSAEISDTSLEGERKTVTTLFVFDVARIFHLSIHCSSRMLWSAKGA